MLEVELKFQIPEARRVALMKALEGKKSEQIQLKAKYYDTPDKKLATAHAAIRQRLEGNTWIQTFKASRSHVARFEHNHNLGELSHEPQLDLNIYNEVPEAKTLLRAALGDDLDQLMLIFETDIARTLQVMTYGNSEIEVSLDQGEIRAQGRTYPIYEIEFELKTGEIADLFAFSFEWVKKYQLWLDVRSKAEFGNLLADGLAVRPVKPSKPLVLLKKDNSDANLRSLIAQHLHALLPNVAAMSAGVATQAHIQQAHQSLDQLHLSLLLFKNWSPDLQDKWLHQLAAFKAQFEQLKQLEHMQTLLQQLLHNPKTTASLAQDHLFATEKLQHLVRSSQNVHHFLELMQFSLAPSHADALEMKTATQQSLHGHYKQLAECLHEANLQDLSTMDALMQRIGQFKFSFPLLTQIYDVKHLQKYGKALQEAADAAEQYQLIARAIEYLQETELATSDWFVLGWLSAKQEVYAERVLDATAQFLFSRKLIKA